MRMPIGERDSSFITECQSFMLELFHIYSVQASDTVILPRKLPYPVLRLVEEVREDAPPPPPQSQILQHRKDR